MSRIIGSCFLALLVMCALPRIPAQTGAASVQGTVRDSSAAVIPGAELILVHAATSTRHRSSTNHAGLFLFPSLPIGEYSIAVSSPGMETWEGKLVLRAGQSMTVDPQLKPAATSTSVTVAGDVTSLVTLDSATIGSTVERARVEQLPLNGRSINSLLAITTPGIEKTQRAYGLLSHALEMVQDGAVLANLELGYITTRPPGLDSVEEFKVETNNSSAKMNRPATVIVTTRSGTNELHGSAFETARNSGLGVARRRQDYYTKPPHLVRNEFGFWTGGPVYLPKLFDGRNKTFFFFNYEAGRQAAGTTLSTTVPTEEMRRGDFSGLIDGTGRRTTIYDPWSTDSRTWARQPFPNNQIPMMRQSPLAKSLYAITPLPTRLEVNPMVSNNLFAPGPDNQPQNTETVKIDHNLNESNRVFVRYTHGRLSREYPGNNASFPTLGDETNVSFSLTRNESAVFSWTRTISPTFFSETIATYYYEHTDIAGGTRGNWAEQLGLPNPMGGSLFPIITSTGFYQYRQPDNERTARTWTTTVDQNFTKVHGRHELQFGGRFRNVRIYELPDGSRSGQHDFSGPQSGLYDPASGSTYGAVPRTGHAAANLFMGLANNYTNAFVRSTYYFRDREYAAYFQDKWRATPRLTVNAGVRYEEHPPLGEHNKLFSSFDMKSKSFIVGQPLDALYRIGATRPSIIKAFTDIGARYITAKEAGLPASMVHGYPWNFGPRAGFAYRLTQGGKSTVLRGGYALFFYPPPMRNFYANLRMSQPFSVSFQVPQNNAATSPDGLPNYSLRSVPRYVAGANTRDIVNFDLPPNVSRGGFTTYFMDPDQPTTGVHEWNLTLEREIFNRIVFRIGYVGNHGYNLEQWAVTNQAPNNYIWFVTTRQPLPTGAYANVARRNYDTQTYGDLQRYQKSGWSNFNGIQLEVERRFARDFGFQFFYVMGNAFRAAGNGWSDGLLQDTNMFLPGAVPQDEHERNRFLNYERDTAVAKHRIRWNWLVDLPFGRGKLLGRNAGGFLDRLIGGWQIAGLGNISSNYWALPTGNWGYLGDIEVYGKKYKIEDCRSGACIPGYLYYNGYIPANRINSYDPKTGKPNGVMGVPANYKPASLPIIPMPADGGSASDPNQPYYDSNTVWVPLANGSVQRIGYDSNLHPWQNQYRLGPFSFGMDASLFKNTRINERFTVRFNADFFNVLNMPGLAQPNSSTGILSLQNSAQAARQLQLSLRLSW
ncbi:MAG: TonB-dependent receptor domain-containing protein [Bryobacteraceae bacterium]